MRIKMNDDIDVDESSESPEKCQRLEWNFNSLIIHQMNDQGVIPL